MMPAGRLLPGTQGLPRAEEVDPTLPLPSCRTGWKPTARRGGQGRHSRSTARRLTANGSAGAPTRQSPSAHCMSTEAAARFCRGL